MEKEEFYQFHISLAEGFLNEAEIANANGKYYAVVRSSCLAIWNIAKAMISIFSDLQKDYEIAIQLEMIKWSHNLRKEIEEKLNILSRLTKKYDSTKFNLSTFGNEEERKPPWQIYDKSQAEEALDDVYFAFKLTEEVYSFVS